MTSKKILLGLLPYWTPLIPPQGITSLKVFLEKHGFKVKTVDANVENAFKVIYESYFLTLKKVIPESHWGNFYNIGHDVLRNHMMACFNRTDEKEYHELVRILVYNTFFYTLNPQQVNQLSGHIDRFYEELEKYFIHLLETEKPDVVGLAAHLGTLAASMFAFRLIKERYPDILTAAGGSIFAGELPMQSTDFTYLLEKTPYIDKVIIGQGEQLLLKLLEDELSPSQRVYTMKDIGNA